MPERPLAEPSHIPDGVSPGDRDIRIEELLLAGLDHYFGGEYERAITAWTRVLFIDRGHARAKAYIDRARSAIAERQRESEELLHRGVAAFDRGETENARRLLTSAVERGGPQEVALAFLERLARLERPGQSPAAVPASPARRRRRPMRRVAAAGVGRRRAAWLLPLVVLALILATAFYLQDSRERVAPFLFLTDLGTEGPSTSPAAVEPLPIPRTAEIDLARARSLFASGHARDALRLVERIRPTDPLRAESDALREDIQQVLLSGGASSPEPRADAPSTLPAPRDQ